MHSNARLGLRVGIQVPPFLPMGEAVGFESGSPSESLGESPRDRRAAAGKEPRESLREMINMLRNTSNPQVEGEREIDR